MGKNVFILIIYYNLINLSYFPTMYSFCFFLNSFFKNHFTNLFYHILPRIWSTKVDYIIEFEFHFRKARQGLIYMFVEIYYLFNFLGFPSF